MLTFLHSSETLFSIVPHNEGWQSYRFSATVAAAVASSAAAAVAAAAVAAAAASFCEQEELFKL